MATAYQTPPATGSATDVATAANLPNYTRAEVTDAASDLQLVHDLLAGTRRMWSRASTYIPKWKDEERAIYAIRSRCETLFEGFGRTLSAAIGLLFAKPPQVTWNGAEAAMTEQWQNIDGVGTAGEVFVKRFAETSLRDGLAAILVDHPSPPKDPETGRPVPINAANEQTYGLRPRWARYCRDQIINWRFGAINNQTKATLLVFCEAQDEDDGLYGVRSVERYRVLRLVLTPDGYQATWRVFEYRGGTDGRQVAGNYVEIESGVFRNRLGVIAQELPVAICYTGRTDAPMGATIPLLGVAWANLSHWQQSTDLRFYRMLSAFPQPTVVGDLAAVPGPGGTMPPGKLRLGPAVAVQLTQGSTFTWSELTGTSMTQLESGIAEKLKQMAQLGMSFLATDTRAAETAEAKRLDAAAENSTLATAAQGIEDAINQALEYHAWYLGIDTAQAPTIQLSRDFESTVLDAQTMAVYVDFADKLHFPLEDLLNVLKQGGRLPQDADVDAIARKMRLEQGTALPNELNPAAVTTDLQNNLTAARDRIMAGQSVPPAAPIPAAA